jgi:hypothetical protein
MDHIEILTKMMGEGATLEIYAQTKDDPIPAAFLDGEHVSVTQAVRAVNNSNVNRIASAENWSAYQYA